MALIWYKHAETGAEVLQAESGRAILASAGWFPMPPEDVEALNQARADEEAAMEAAMRADAERARAANGGEPAAPQVAEETAQVQIKAARNSSPARPLDESDSTEENN